MSPSQVVYGLQDSDACGRYVPVSPQRGVCLSAGRRVVLDHYEEELRFLVHQDAAHRAAPRARDTTGA